jgi:hypothetical protein
MKLIKVFDVVNKEIKGSLKHNKRLLIDELLTKIEKHISRNPDKFIKQGENETHFTLEINAIIEEVNK